MPCSTKALLGLLVAIAAVPSVISQGLLESDLTRVYARQTTSSATICATVDIVVPLTEFSGAVDYISVAENICLCQADSTLTTNTITTLQDIVAANGTGVQILTSDVNGTVAYTSASLLDTLEADASADLSQEPATCTYPDGSIPLSCTDCTYECPTGTFLCGDSCVDTSTTCASGVARRSNVISTAECNTGYTACPIPGSSLSTFECIDTQNNIESCGGCAFPTSLSANVLVEVTQGRGQDCTALPYTSGVACTHGQCVVQGCQDGYKLQENGTACIAISLEDDASTSSSQSVSLIDSLVGQAVKETIFQSRSRNSLKGRQASRN